MKTVDTCTFCIKKKICMPTKPYHGFCQWRETEQTKGQTIERDAREATKRITKRKAKEMCIYDRERNEYRYFL